MSKGLQGGSWRVERMWHWGWRLGIESGLFPMSSVILGVCMRISFYTWEVRVTFSRGPSWTPQTWLKALCASPSILQCLAVICHMESTLVMTLFPLDDQFLQKKVSGDPLTRAWVSPSLLIKLTGPSDLPPSPSQSSMPWPSPHTFCSLIPQNYNDFLCISVYRTTFLYCLPSGYLF